MVACVQPHFYIWLVVISRELIMPLVKPTRLPYKNRELTDGYIIQFPHLRKYHVLKYLLSTHGSQNFAAKEVYPGTCKVVSSLMLISHVVTRSILVPRHRDKIYFQLLSHFVNRLAVFEDCF